MSPRAVPCRVFEEVQTGDELPPRRRDITLTDLVMYAAATWDFHRYHYDEAFARAHGHRAPFVDGQMIGALLAGDLMDWGGAEAFVRRLTYRTRATVYPGDGVVSRGVVTGKTAENGRALVLCTLSMAKMDGTEIVRDATAALELPTRDDVVGAHRTGEPR